MSIYQQVNAFALMMVTRNITTEILNTLMQLLLLLLHRFVNATLKKLRRYSLLLSVSTLPLLKFTSSGATATKIYK